GKENCNKDCKAIVGCSLRIGPGNRNICGASTKAAPIHPAMGLKTKVQRLSKDRRIRSSLLQALYPQRTNPHCREIQTATTWLVKKQVQGGRQREGIPGSTDS